MRILFLSAANSIHTIRWVNALVERGHEVMLVSKADHKVKGQLIDRQVKITYLPVNGMKGYYLNALFLRKLYRDGCFNVVNAHYASGYGTLARIAGLPNVLLSVWGSDVYDFPYENCLKKRILEKNLDYAGGIASTSRGMAEQTKKFLKRKKSIWITPFGVDLHKFTPVYGGTEERKEFVFGTVKTLAPKYGIGTVIRAFGIFLQGLSEIERQNVRLEIYGDGELRQELMALAEELQLSDKVFFGGWIPNDQVPKVLQGMDVFVIGSEKESESFGVAAVEAMACVLPVVATSVTGFREVVEDGKTGFLVAVGDTEGMARKMLELYGDKSLRETMGKRGRKRMEALYGWDECVEIMEGVYEEMSGERF
nr:glycosyltransferase [uncultured Acetatifactor sp.]